MQLLRANITQQVWDYLNDLLESNVSLDEINLKIHHSFGVIRFFESIEALAATKEGIVSAVLIVETMDRAIEYGDFQTNEYLAEKVIITWAEKSISPQVIIEPTCGKGNFIVAALKNFEQVTHIFGVEIYEPYIWEAKFKIIDFFLNNPQNNKPDISIAHCNVFDYDFKTIAKNFQNSEVLIIGNPPWVTNAKLGVLNSSNLPKKTNFKNLNGLDAMTGKGNFDIAESITLQMLNVFQRMKGHLVLLVKSSVIKNIVFDQKIKSYAISDIQKQRIDSKKEFNVSVEAAFFCCKLNSEPAFFCQESDAYFPEKQMSKFGWIADKFVSDVEKYMDSQAIDGLCPFVWRQGLKHDCSAIMELNKSNGHYTNGLNEEVTLEPDLVYGLLKSSDLKNTVVSQTRKYTIVTQKKVGQETQFIKDRYPKTYQYLIDHQTSFEARKSSIYINKPAFSIFGIGDYSFEPYKIAISGLYKTFHFTLVLQQNNKPMMLDDTCYMIGFDSIEFAAYAFILLNCEPTIRLLQSITFADAKRTFTKDVLMRIDMMALAKQININDLQIALTRFNKIHSLALTLDLWEQFIKKMVPLQHNQTELFV
jgi:hypothetical protein